MELKHDGPPLTPRQICILETIKKNGDMFAMTKGVTSCTLKWTNAAATDPCPIWKDIRGLMRKNYVHSMPFGTLGLPGTHVFVTDFSRTVVDTWDYHPRYIKWLRENDRSDDLCDMFEKYIIEKHGLEWSKQIDSMEYKG